MSHPAPAAATDSPINKYSVSPGPDSPAGGAPFSAAFANTGSRNFSTWFDPPRLAGHPSQPAVIEKNARVTSGTVIDLGDSWMWCSTSWLVTRDGLRNVR